MSLVMFLPVRLRKPWFASVFSIGHGERLLFATNTDGTQSYSEIHSKLGRRGASNAAALSRLKCCELGECGDHVASTMLLHDRMTETVRAGDWMRTITQERGTTMDERYSSGVSSTIRAGF
jgi:hypothetical protein